MTTTTSSTPAAPPAAPTGGLRAFLRLPHAPALARAAVLSRLAVGGQAVALLLAVGAVYSVGTAGLAVGALTAGLAVGQVAVPVIGRRTGTVRMLRWSSVLSLVAAAAVTFALLAELPVAVLLGAALLAGVASPPTGSVIRSLVPRLSDDDDVQDAAFKADGTAGEVGELAAPLAAGLLIAVGLPALAVLAFAACETASGLLLARLAARVPDPDRDTETPAGVRTAVLRLGLVRRLLPVAAASSVAITVAQVVLTGLADQGLVIPASVLLTVLAAGGVSGGLLPLRSASVTRRTADLAVAASLLALSAGLVLSDLTGPLAAAAVPGLVVVAAFVVSAAVTRLIVTAMGALGRSVERTEDRTAAFGAVATGSLVGAFVGSASAGAALTAGFAPLVPAAVGATVVVAVVLRLALADQASR